MGQVLTWGNRAQLPAQWAARARDRLELARGHGLLLGNVVHRFAAVHGDRRLVEEAGDPPLVLTHGEAAAQVDEWAEEIGARIAPGDRVVIAVPNGYRMFLLCVAASRAGGVAVPVNPAMRESEVEHVVADSGATLVLRDPAVIPGERRAGASAAATPAPSAGDVAAIFYTSGTTGLPKGARLSHRALLGHASMASLWPAGLRRDEAVMGLPVAHIMGFALVLVMAAAGVPTYFLPRVRPDETLDAIESRRATVFAGVPAMYRMLVEAGAETRDLGSVRLWITGADVMPGALARRFKAFGATATLPGGRSVGEAMFVEGYGMVELAGGLAIKVSPPFLPVGVGESLGIRLPAYQVKIVDDDGHELPRGQVGELVVKGPGVLQGYHGDEAATRAVLTPDGWLRTGDLVRRGPFGILQFAGRKKEVVKHGGYSVYTTEVERALEEHPAVAEAAVVGLPDERLGEVPAAAVRLHAGQAVDEAELQQWARDRLAEYKVPRQVRLVDDLPRTGTQKVQKARVRELFAAT